MLATATADASSSFTVASRAPQTPYAPRLFSGLGQSSGKLGAASFYARARLTMSPASGPTGSAVTAQALRLWLAGAGSDLLELNNLHGAGEYTGAHGYGSFTAISRQLTESAKARGGTLKFRRKDAQF